ncbi:MAG: bifunctional 4-hydroxy-2-oxoglutarate aldolase/2-dehydro-3-deoxy-phosphogluconate aldolase [Pseudoramibacter sp.]
MDQSALLKIFEAEGVVPAMIIENADDAVGAVNAMAAGGIHTAEITFRSSAAADAIARIAADAPESLVGAGTVLNAETAEKAVAAGAQFIVSPGINPDVVHWCQDHQVPVVPGVATPSEIELGLSLRLNRFKFFPAEASGGTAALKAFASPYRGVRFLPTGGVNADNLGDYLALPNVFAVGGSWICPKDLVAAHDFEKITALCRAAQQAAGNI